jgi:hypothetical protein
MLPFGVTIPATVPHRSEIPEGLMNNLVQSISVGKVEKARPWICWEPAVYNTLSQTNKWKYILGFKTWNKLELPILYGRLRHKDIKLKKTYQYFEGNLCHYVCSGRLLRSMLRHADCSLHASPQQTPRKNKTCYAAALPHSHVWIFTFLIQWL